MFTEKVFFNLEEFRIRTLPSEQEIISCWSGRLDNPVVSVICNTYNQDKYIEDALKGFLLQRTTFPFEVIINDDASTDQNQKIIRDYADRYPRIIKPIFQEENRYSKGERPTVLAFLKSRGDYIALCEGDDFWIDESKLQRQFNILEQDTNVDGCAHAAFAIYPTGESRLICRYEHSRLNCKDVIEQGGGIVPTASLFLRRSVVEQFSIYFKEAPLGDYFIQVLAARTGGLAFSSVAQSVYRYASETSVSQSEDRKSSDEMYQFVRKFDIALEMLERILPKQYGDSIKIFKASMYKEAAVRALINTNNKRLFFKLMNLSKITVVNKRHMFLLCFLRFPEVVKIVYKLRHVIGHFPRLNPRS